MHNEKPNTAHVADRSLNDNTLWDEVGKRFFETGVSRGVFYD